MKYYKKNVIKNQMIPKIVPFLFGIGIIKKIKVRLI